MQTILRNIVRACFDKTFYQETEKDTFGRRFAHLYVVFVFVMIAFSIQLGATYLTNQKEIRTSPQKINTLLGTLYPKDLVLKFDKNALSINQPMPYVLGRNFTFDPTQEAVNTDEDTTQYAKGTIKNFITIDTNASIDNFTTYQSAMLAMKNGIAVKQSREFEVRYYPYSDFLKKVPQPFTFDSISYGQIVNKVRPYINQLPTFILYGFIVLLVLGVLVGPLFLASGVLFNILFLALFGYLIASAMKRKHSYGYIYNLAMYTAIPVIILQQIIGYTPFHGLDSVWWLIALLFLVIFIPPAGGAMVKVDHSPPSPMDPPKVA